MAILTTLGGTYLASTSGVLPSTTSTVSMVTWVNYPLWSTATTTASMVGMYNGTPTSSTTPTTSIQIGARGGVNQVVVWTWGGATLLTSNTFTMPSNGWVHIVYTCTAISGGNQTHSIYVNGQFNISATNAIQAAGTLTQTYINGYPQTAGGTSESATMTIDDTAVYNRVLSANEIATMYACNGLRDGITYGLLAKYAFEESNSGNVVSCIDYSINNTPMTPGAGTGTPTYVAGISYQNTRPAIIQ